MTALAVLSLLIWLYLLRLHGRFWQAGRMLAPARPARTRRRSPSWCRRATRRRSIDAALRSLLAQDYPGAVPRHAGR